MKKLLIPFLAGIAIGCLSSPALAQEFKEHISKEFPVAKGSSGTLLIYNLNGFIKVEGYNGDKVLLEIDKTISADDTAELEKGKRELRLGFDQQGDSITAYIAEPFDTRPHRRIYEDWDDHHKIYYNFNLDFTVKVPYGMNLVAGTVNNGAVSVKDIAGSLKVSNVNGPVTVTNARGITTANSVNGAVVVNYLSNPPGASTYRTVNGNITVTYQPGLSADLQFKSWNGNYYTDFPQFEVLPAIIVKNEERRGGGITYKLDRTNAIRIGAGGATFKFETLNGHIYIKKQS
jgi:hypothetical protein